MVNEDPIRNAGRMLHDSRAHELVDASQPVGVKS